VGGELGGGGRGGGWVVKHQCATKRSSSKAGSALVPLSPRCLACVTSRASEQH
jgi:hypothetical protein